MPYNGIVPRVGYCNLNVVLPLQKSIGHIQFVRSSPDSTTIFAIEDNRGHIVQIFESEHDAPGLLFVFIGLVAMCGLGWRFSLGLYSSPMAMATAAVGFFVFKRISVMQWGG